MNRFARLIFAATLAFATTPAYAWARGFGGSQGADSSGLQSGVFGGSHLGGYDAAEFGHSYYVGRGDFDTGETPGGVFDSGGSWRGINPGGAMGETLGGGGMNASGGGTLGSGAGGFRFGVTPHIGPLGALTAMPTDGGLHIPLGGASGRANVAGADRAAPSQRAPAAADSNSSAGQGFGALNGIRYFSPTYLRAQALATQRWYAGRTPFTPAWAAAHPWAWQPPHPPSDWATALWQPAAWSSLGVWLGWNPRPVEYRYGSNVIYDAGNVYFDGDKFVATAANYYQEALELAKPGAAKSASDADWLPLGVFAVVASGQKKPALTLQMAIDKQGYLRGNSTSEGSPRMAIIEGALDKKSQRVAWTIGDNKTTVYETGLYNLTHGETPALVHVDEQHTDLLLLVRLKAAEPEPGNRD